MILSRKNFKKIVSYYNQVVTPYFAWDYMIGKYLNNKKIKITHKSDRGDIPFFFYIPNFLAKYRAKTFSTKEPETLEWIDKYLPQNGVLFDIGANVGLYSIYHAKTKKGWTYAFEPSVFNLKLLVKNINANECQERVRIVSNPLTSQNSFADFNLQSTDEGGALSSFGVDYGHDGNVLDKQISYQTLGFSLDYLVANKIIDVIPNGIKLDVDGIEHLILKGAKEVLSHKECKTVLIEVNEAFLELASEVDIILKDSGFRLLEKRSAEVAEQIVNADSNYTYNQIWVK